MTLRKLTLLAGALFAGTMLASCATTGIDGTNGIPCVSDPPLSWSQHDTKETQRGVVGHNAVVTKLCPMYRQHHVL